MLIVDGEKFIVGGRNWDGRYFRFVSKNAYKDFDVLVEGESTTQAQSSFNKVWQSKLVSLPNYSQFTAERLSPAFCDHSDQDTPEQCYWDQKKAIKLYLDQVARIQKFQVEEPSLSGMQGEAEKGVDGQITFLSHQEDKLVSPKTADMTIRLLQLFRTATKELNIVTPYLVLPTG